MYKNLSILFVILISPAITCADTTVTNAKIIRIHSGYDALDGVFLTLDKSVPESLCSSTQVFLGRDHIKFSETYSLLLVAATGGKAITLGTNGCTPTAHPNVRYLYVIF